MHTCSQLTTLFCAGVGFGSYQRTGHASADCSQSVWEAQSDEEHLCVWWSAQGTTD